MAKTGSPWNVQVRRYDGHQGGFTKGVVYLDVMQANVSELLDDCDFNFGSGDLAVVGYLKLAQSLNRSGSTACGHVLKFANA